MQPNNTMLAGLRQGNQKMTLGEIIVVVLSSSVLASVTTAVLGGIVNRVLKKLDYADEYYKTVISKRVEAYELVENQIVLLKNSCLDEDGQPYHLIFAYGYEQYHHFMAGMSRAMSRGLWLSDTVQNSLVEINHELLDLSFKSTDDENLILLGKERYERLALLRNELERKFTADLKILHEVKGFLSGKQEGEHQFVPFSIEKAESTPNRVAGGL
ncbi:hypothetical protein [Aliidiomarina quisquiliarum]|uniref:hypothetical protein n=1 Tax=Aliidiomarina quisquiliarum TaxID=2938947 RepID=UPI00208DE34A|nr:hypothetical protein [Aliidiomarina quisquiliarum]MCO4320690.1 hypothetical protein [Aliidiomarina quisquiliarum]